MAEVLILLAKRIILSIYFMMQSKYKRREKINGRSKIYDTEIIS